MQLATSTATPRDKSAWPSVRPLPTDLPPAARSMPARYDLWARFSAGSWADARDGYAARVSPTWGPESIDMAAVRYVGTDPRAALAAAVARAGAAHLQPGTQDGVDHHEHTMVGLYRTGGSWFTAPMWVTPGTNDWQHYIPLGNRFGAGSDARFTFRDDRLVAVVGLDGFIANPANPAAGGL